MSDTQTSGAKHLTTAEFDQFLTTAGDQPVLVDFYAEWCGPCQMAAPLVDQLATKKQGTAHVVKVNVDEEPTIAQRYGVRSIPTFVVIKNNKEVGKTVGFGGEAALTKLIDDAVAMKPNK